MGSAHSLERLLDRRRRALLAHLPRALGDDATAIHQARVASRRLREAIPVVGASLRPRRVRQLRRRLRRLTRLLGPVREQDVARAGLDRLLAADGDAAELVALARRRGERVRAAALARLVRRFDPGRAERLAKGLAKCSRGIPDPVLVTRWREVLAARLRDRAHDLLSAVADAGALFAPDRLHTVRIAVKKLRYAIELASETRVAAAGATLRSLREAQTVLGDLHDLDVLAALLAGAVAVPHPRADLVAAHRRLADRLGAQGRELHARYLRRQSALIGAADRALDAVAPRVTRAPADR